LVIEKEKSFDQTGSYEERGEKTGEGEIESHQISQKGPEDDKTCSLSETGQGQTEVNRDVLRTIRP
jgi:hypothetical protein